MGLVTTLTELEVKASRWLYKTTIGIQPAKALNGGIPKDESYMPKEPFFVNGKSKFPPLSPQLPNIKNSNASKFDSLIDSLSSSLNPFSGGKKTGEIDTEDKRVSPAEYFDQYLESLEGGKESLLEEVKKRYLEDESKLPWRMDPDYRDKRFEVEERENASGYFNRRGEKVVVGTQTEENLSKNPILNPKLSEGGLSGFKREVREINGLDPENGSISTPEIIGHELAHGYTIDRSRMRSMETIPPISPERPYFFGISEEYKVGALTFLNKSRQLTGKKLTDPQEIHQLFDEIERDPTILDKNYSPEEARLPRTYLLLKKTNPEGATLLRNATARDCQYLAHVTDDLKQASNLVANRVVMEKVDQDVIRCISQLDSPLALTNRKISKIATNLEQPVSLWLQNEKGLNKNKTKDLKDPVIGIG
jgi:hypothetical protein